MKLRCTAVLLIGVLTSAGESAAQEFFHDPQASGQVRAAVVSYDNFFQAPTGRATRDVRGGLLEFRMEQTVGESDRLKAYTHLEFVTFRGLGASPGLVVGVKRKGRVHSFEVESASQWNRPRSDVGDELELGNLFGGAASYAIRVVGALQVMALGEYRAEFLKDQGTPDTRFREFGGALTYRAFGGRLSPEVGLTRGTRTASNANADYVQRTPYINIRTTLPRVNLGVRYKQPRREYLVADLMSKNFARKDRRRSMSASVDISIGEHQLWSFFGGLDEGSSTRAGRAFIARSFGTGFILAY
jgi:hypothetical protein